VSDVIAGAAAPVAPPWMDLPALRGHVEALAAMTRDSAGAGEREAAGWVAGRLREAGVREVTVEPYRGATTYGWAHVAHAAAGLVAAARGGWAGTALALAALGSLEADMSGRGRWVRRLLPAGEGANVVGRVPARGARRAALLLVAHHDAARTGLMWHPRLTEAGSARRLRRRRIAPLGAPVAGALGLVAAGGLPGARRPGRAARAGGALVLAAIAALEAQVARGPTVPGATDNATGVAVLVELARALARNPLEEVELLVATTGAEESGMEGMSALLARHGAELVPERSLVLNLDHLGAGTPMVLLAEGAIRTHRYREADLALADAGAGRAGLPPPPRWRIGGWTDAAVARRYGLPALSVMSMGPGYLPDYHRLTDTPDRVRWSSVEGCARLAAGIVAAFADACAAAQEET
jgi:hypothetical protein